MNPYKFKINATGSLTINGNSTITITNSSTAPEIAIALLELRYANTNNKNTIKTLNESIDAVRASSSKILYLVAFSDEEERRMREWYPGVQILRAPLKIDANKSSI